MFCNYKRHISSVQLIICAHIHVFSMPYCVVPHKQHKRKRENIIETSKIILTSCHQESSTIYTQERWEKHVEYKLVAFTLIHLCTILVLNEALLGKKDLRDRRKENKSVAQCQQLHVIWNLSLVIGDQQIRRCSDVSCWYTMYTSCPHSLMHPGYSHFSFVEISSRWTCTDSEETTGGRG